MVAPNLFLTSLKERVGCEAERLRSLTFEALKHYATLPPNKVGLAVAFKACIYRCFQKLQTGIFREGPALWELLPRNALMLERVGAKNPIFCQINFIA